MFSLFHLFIQDERSVLHIFFKSILILKIFIKNFCKLEPFLFQYLDEIGILLDEVCLQLLSEYFFIHEVNHPNPATGHLVLISRTYSPPRSADLKGFFSRNINPSMIGKDE